MADHVLSLSKYLAVAGISARRKAVDLIKAGKVAVNGTIVTHPAHRIFPGDVVAVQGKTVKPQIELRYIMLNKPLGVVSTASDEHGRPTVLELIDMDERLYPIGRLDINTTGIILLTNDGALAHQLAHPSFEISKKYRVHLDKPVLKEHMAAVRLGIVLPDGPIAVDAITYSNRTHTQVDVTLHSGRNRIVRRIFKYMGYQVLSLDRIGYANLTLEGLANGQWRVLTHEEVDVLKKKVQP